MQLRHWFVYWYWTHSRNVINLISVINPAQRTERGERIKKGGWRWREQNDRVIVGRILLSLKEAIPPSYQAIVHSYLSLCPCINPFLHPAAVPSSTHQSHWYIPVFIHQNSYPSYPTLQNIHSCSHIHPPKYYYLSFIPSILSKYLCLFPQPSIYVHTFIHTVHITAWISLYSPFNTLRTYFRL